MFRAACSVVYSTTQRAFNNVRNIPKILPSYNNVSRFGTMTRLPLPIMTTPKPIAVQSLRLPTLIQPIIPCTVPSRSVTKFSMRKGKRKAVKTVLKRFYRLHWGGWIRTIAGRHRKMWRKSAARRLRLRKHVLCNSQQSYMLDKMVTNFWRKPKYYVDDPYEPYHTREEFDITRRKPIVRD